MKIKERCIQTRTLYIAHNGKRLCEVREFEGLKVQEFRNEADAFFGLLNYKNNQYEKAAAAKYLKSFNLRFLPHFANTMLGEKLN